MWVDVIDLRDFYGSGLGRTTRRMIGRRVRALWPDVRGMNVLGFGYATPFLGVFRAEAERVIAVMPAAQGVCHWPTDQPGLTVLADEASLPFPDRCIDRLLVVHALEYSDRVPQMMRELWRVLADGGQLLVVAANRSGLWARFERTPFGHGRPYSPFQLSYGLREAMFTPQQTATALYVPPIHSRMLMSSAVAWEKIGQRWFNTFAGVVLVSAMKQIYAGTAVGERARRPVYVPVISR